MIDIPPRPPGWPDDQITTQELTTRIYSEVVAAALPTGTSAILIVFQNAHEHGPGLSCGIGTNLPPHITAKALEAVAKRIVGGDISTAHHEGPAT